MFSMIYEVLYDLLPASRGPLSLSLHSSLLVFSLSSVISFLLMAFLWSQCVLSSSPTLRW